MSEPFQSDLYGQTVVRVSRPYDTQLKPLGDLALAKLNAQHGEYIIDIGCGAAQTCLQIGEAVGLSGSVLGIDISPVLVDFAAERTSSMPQIQIVRGDAGTFAFEPHTYDALYSRFGVMAFKDPVSTFSNLHSALKPGGRLAFVCWRSFGENELDNLPFHAAMDYLPYDDVQNVERAAPFSFSDPGIAKAVLCESGFGGIKFSAHNVRVSAGDLDSTLELCLSAGALGGIIRKSAELREDVVEPVRKALATKGCAQGVFMNAAVWTVTANAQ